MKNLIMILLTCFYSFSQNPNEVVKLGLEELQIEDVNVVVRPMSPRLMETTKSMGIELDGFINKEKEGYIITVNDLSDKKIRKTIAHELIHLKQIHSGELVIVNPNTVIYKDRKYNKIHQISYTEKPWEYHATGEGSDLYFKIMRTYKKKAVKLQFPIIWEGSLNT